ncbi:hypothetical protein LguiB_013523 [Lonicera macranthoides]
MGFGMAPSVAVMIVLVLLVDGVVFGENVKGFEDDKFLMGPRHRLGGVLGRGIYGKGFRHGRFGKGGGLGGGAGLGGGGAGFGGGVGGGD